MFFSHYNLIISSLSNWLITDVTSVVPAMAREGWYAIVNCLTEQSLLISFTPSFTLVLTYSQSSNPIPALIGSNCLNPGLWLVAWWRQLQSPISNMRDGGIWIPGGTAYLWSIPHTRHCTAGHGHFLQFCPCNFRTFFMIFFFMTTFCSKISKRITRITYVYVMSVHWF